MLAIFSRSFLLLILGALITPVTALAQSASYCSPQGVNSAGMPCTPVPQAGIGMSSGGATSQPGAALPGATQQGGIPTITNRPPSTIPQSQYPSLEQQQYLQQQQQFPQQFGQQGFGFPERNEFQDFVAQSVGRDLPMFGYNLFQGAPSTFAPVDRVPVTADYVIGPGDELLIRAWGQVDIDYRAVVDRDGAISIPKVGNINVSGIRFQDLQSYLKTAIGRLFRNFELNVAMGQLRSIQVFVVGHAARPGSYTVSSLSSLVNAIFASGGPTTKGSMRSIQLKRGDKVVTQFDMYDLLVRGDKSKDVQLLPGDVIYIPPVGQLAAVSGSVNNAAVYEITSATSLADLMALAGGLAATADGQKVTIERIVDRKVRKVEELKLDKDGMAHPVRDGDLVQVLPLSPRFDNAVTVKGNVAVPARHPWHPGITVRDVVPDKDALIVPDYWIKRNLLTRGDVTGRSSLAKRTDMLPSTVWGQRQDTFGQRQDAFGQRQDAFGQRQDAFGQRQDAFGQRQDATSPQRLDPANLQRPDPVTQERLRTDLKRSLHEVNWDYAVVERLNRNDLTTQLIPFNLGKAILEGDAQNNLLLQPGDVITIFSKDDIQVSIAKQSRFVKLEGEVATSGVYQALPGETLRQLVARVGGLSPNAYLYGSTFTRESTRVLQQKRFDEFVDRLEQEVTRNAAQTAISAEEAGAQKVASQNQVALVAHLRQVKATGRIVLEIPPDGAGVGSLPDIPVEDGDTLSVPARPSTVAVVGTVYNENSFLFRPNKSMNDYLKQSGGPTKDADADSLYIIRADGSIVSKRQDGWFTSFSGQQLMPGDTVVVPQKLDKYLVARQFKDWSQIFYQFALGVAGLKVLKGL